jgi:hypothetical protein
VVEKERKEELKAHIQGQNRRKSFRMTKRKEKNQQDGHSPSLSSPLLIIKFPNERANLHLRSPPIRTRRRSRRTRHPPASNRRPGRIIPTGWRRHSVMHPRRRMSRIHLRRCPTISTRRRRVHRRQRTQPAAGNATGLLLLLLLLLAWSGVGLGGTWGSRRAVRAPA